MISNLTPDKKLIRARNKLLLEQPFFGVLALKLQVIEDKTCQTAWTDGKRMGYNPDFIAKLPDGQVRGLVAHEVMHCVYKHQTRRKEREPRKWNMAADYAINPGLIEAGFELPEGGCVDDKYKNMSTDHIYTLLPDPPECDSSSGWGEVRDGDYESSSERADQDQDWTVSVRQAAEAAKKAGNLPGHLEGLIDTVLNPKVPWKEVLRNFMTQPRKDDYSMTRPNRRYISSGLYLPAMWSEGLGDIVITVDTSGSISKEELDTFCSEINCILQDTHPQKVYVLYCDTQVHKKVDEYTTDDLPISLHYQGGGGTDFTEPFKWVEDHALTPDAFIYLTDMYGSCSAPPPIYPVLWISTTECTDAAFGEVIQMN